MDKPREYYNIKRLLGNKGYIDAAENDSYIWSVLDYLDMMPSEYTIFDWLNDTEKNYPEDLIGEEEDEYD